MYTCLTCIVSIVGYWLALVPAEPSPMQLETDAASPRFRFETAAKTCGSGSLLQSNTESLTALAARLMPSKGNMTNEITLTAPFDPSQVQTCYSFERDYFPPFSYAGGVVGFISFYCRGGFNHGAECNEDADCQNGVDDGVCVEGYHHYLHSVSTLGFLVANPFINLHSWLEGTFVPDVTGEHTFVARGTITGVVDSVGLNYLGHDKGIFDISTKTSVIPAGQVCNPTTPPLPGSAVSTPLFVEDDGAMRVISEAAWDLIKSAMGVVGAMISAIEASLEGTATPLVVLDEEPFEWTTTASLSAGESYKWKIGVRSHCESAIFGLGQNASMVNFEVVIDEVVVSPPELVPVLSVHETSGTPDDDVLEFDLVPSGSGSTEPFTITNSGAGDLIIDSWVSDNPAFTLSPPNPAGPVGDVTRGPAEWTQVEVTFAPQAEGPASALITITCNDDQNCPYYLHATGHGWIPVGGVVLTPDSPQPYLVSPNESVTFSAAVFGGDGSPVGQDHEVNFVTLCFGTWSGHDYTCHPGVCSLTNSSGVATAIWTAGSELCTADPVTATHTASGQSDTVLISVRSDGSVNCSPSNGATRFNCGDCWARYRVSIWFLYPDDSPITNADVTWYTSRGTIESAENQTNGAGHAEAHVYFDSEGPATVTGCVFGDGCCSVQFNAICCGPCPSHPAGCPMPGGGACMDLCESGTKAAFGQGRSISVLDLPTQQLTSRNFEQELLADVLAVAMKNDCAKVGVGIDYRQRGIVTVGDPLSGVFPVTPSGEGVNDGKSAAWVCDRLLLGHEVTSSYPYQFSLYDTNANLLDKESFTDDDSEDIYSIAVRPNHPCQFAAISDGPESSNHNFVYYGYVSGNSIGEHNHFLTPIRNRGLSWSGDGAELVVGSPSFEHQLVVYNASDLSSGSPSPATIISISGYGEHIAFSSDSSYMAVTGEGSTSVTIYDTSGTPTSWAPILCVQLNEGCTGLEWLSGTHRLLAAGGSHTQLVYLDDTDLPDVSLDSPPCGQSTTTEAVTVCGQASDENGICGAQIRVGGGAWEELALDGSGHFCQDIALSIGLNQIEVEATDKAGWSATAFCSIERLCDNDPPIIGNVEVSPPSCARTGDPVTVCATIIDAMSGVDESTCQMVVQFPDETDLVTILLVRDVGDRFCGTWDTTGNLFGQYWIDLFACDAGTCPGPNCAEVENASEPQLTEFPSLTIQEPADVATVGWGEVFTVAWNTSDPDSDALTSLYLDADCDPGDGLMPIPGGTALGEEVTSLEVPAEPFDPGTYYVYARACDECGCVTACSTGQITIEGCLTADDCPDDGNPCTSRTCQEGSCVYPSVADGTPCDDAAYCNGMDTCLSGVCTEGAQPCGGNHVCNETYDVCLPDCNGNAIPDGTHLPVECDLPGDMSGDGYVDLDDYQQDPENFVGFYDCLGGPCTDPPCEYGGNPCCVLADFDEGGSRDGDVDLRDFANFQLAMSVAVCGDGFVSPGVEQCDDGFTDACGSCNATCDGPGNGSTCGDGVVCPETETCDDGFTDACGSCNATCGGAGSGSTCGDSVVCPETETCDDGGESAVCDTDCTVAECGDGTVNVTAGEECDDGNTVSGDGCSTVCLEEIIRLETVLSVPDPRSLRIGDVDNDGSNELLVSGGQHGAGTVRIYKYQEGIYQEIWSHTFPSDEANASDLCIGDPDSDGDNDFLVSTSSDRSGYVRFFKHDGGATWSEAARVSTSGTWTHRNLAIGDADNDGVNEVAVAESNYGRKMNIYEYADGAYSSVYTDAAGGDYRSVSIGDADNDGLNEIWTNCDYWGPRDFRVIEYSGGIYSVTWTYSFGSRMLQSFIGDTDNDGEREVLAVTSWHDNVGEVVIFEWDGSTYTVELLDVGVGGYWYPLVADVLNSGQNQILFRDGTDTIRVYEYDGDAYVERAALAYPASDFWVGDVDNDGFNELVTTRSSDNEIRIFGVTP